MITVYPHDDLPLFPLALIAAFDADHLTADNGKKYPLAALTDLAFCRSLSADDHKEASLLINKMVQKVCYGRLDKYNWGKATLNLPTSISISDLKLTNRALVSLQNIALFGQHGAWRTAKVEDIIGGRANHLIGARLMLALLLAVEDFHRDQNSYLSQKSSLVKVATTLEEQISALVREVIHSPRTLEIFLDINGWGLNGRRDLHSIALSMSITHERARQIRLIGDTAFKQSRFDHGRMNIIRAAKDRISSLCPMLESEANETLEAEGFTKCGFSVESLMLACKHFGVQSDLICITQDGQRIICKEEHESEIKLIRKLIRQKIRELGLIDVEDLKQQVIQRLLTEKSTVTQETTRQVFSFSCYNMPGWVFLDAEEKWGMITIGSHGEELLPRGVVTKVARMAYYYNGINVSVAQQIFLRRNLLWPPEILISLCLRSGIKVKPIHGDWWIENKGEVVATAGQFLEKTAEYKIAELLKQHTDGVKRQDLVVIGEQFGLNKSTIFAVIRNSSLLFYDEKSKKVSLLQAR